MRAWPLDWQRHYTDCLDSRAQLGDLLPGMTIHGLNVGRWSERQRQHIVWQGLLDGQRERLAALGVEPLAVPAEEAAPRKKAGAGKPSVFDRGVAALAQVPGAHRIGDCAAPARRGDPGR
ncbi:helicase associated domain-containing protein [Kitasatospora aureofaciens]|uniref:helicase associated domain-containing protein n=1 Tax=Kitasatospora aureofaciens TaxID=1894 RepID=UPI0033FC0601